MKHIDCPIKCDVKKVIDDINIFPRAIDKRNRIKNSKKLIADLSNKLKINFEGNNFILPHSHTTIEATKEDMVSLYRDKFVKSAYYNMLVSQYFACPVCGTRFVETVDHYLPKSIYYTFSVTPINLVPMCFRCNKAKNEVDPFMTSNHIFHPYFDEIDDFKFLKMTFSFDKSGNFVPRFEIVGKDCKEKEIYKTNYKLFKLKERYEEESVVLFQNNISMWRQIFIEAGADTLKNIMLKMVDSNPSNPVYKPFYVSFNSNIDTLISYLEATK